MGRKKPPAGPFRTGGCLNGASAACAVRRGGLAEISVSDHGPGIPPAVLENLQSGAGNEGVGLENVHRRLKSIYGEENGLQAVNTPEGACVYFTVPAEGLPKYDAV